MNLSIDKKILNPLLRPEEKARLSFRGRPEFSVENIYCAYDEPVARVNADGVVTPLRGGLCRIVARKNGERAEVRLAVAPFYLDYSRIPAMKLDVLREETLPDGRVARYRCGYEQIKELILRLDRLTLGLPRIIYLVGWQLGGHDYDWPCMERVDPALQGPEATPLEGLRSLIRWGREHNTIISLHINLMDAYEDSPYWDEYLAKDVIARETDGSVKYVTEFIKGRPLRHISYTREWDEGLTQRRLDRLLEMIPELAEGHTIHVDAFHTFWFEKDENGKRIMTSVLPISPYHAEKYGITPETDHATQRRIFEYMRARGLDITCECSNSLRIEPFFGLQPMMWWCGGRDAEYFKAAPACMYTGGMGAGFMIGESLHGEEQFCRDLNIGDGFLGEFCRTTLPWYCLNRHERLRVEENRVEYSDGLAAYMDGENRVIRQGDMLLRENDTVFVPVMWIDGGGRYILAHSGEGCDRDFALPESWRGAAGLRTYRIDPLRGPVETGRLAVRESCVRLRLAPGETALLERDT